MKTFTEQPATLAQTNPAASESFSQLASSLQSRNGLVLLGCCLLVGVFALLGDRKKGKLATSRFGSAKEKGAARKRAVKQLTARKHNAVSLYIGKPQRPKDARSIYLPDLQRGVAVCGGPGSGKTFSVIDPLIRSALEQGLPVALYDFKYPTQSARHAAYAAKLGYQVHVLAPGFPESGVCNPIDFLRSESDAEMARQIATVLNKNFRLMTQSSEDGFFAAAGDQLTEALLMLAKSTEYPDIMTAQAVLGLTNLGNRIAAAKDMNSWIRVSFNQLIGVKDAEKTASGIVGSASETFTRFMKEGVLGSFCGRTSIPLELEGKQLLIFGMDRERRDVVGPLVATVLHMIVTRNVAKRRQDPLIVAIDELPTLYLPTLVQWLNENREDGLSVILGFQNLVQLEKTYGRELARAILGACATKAIFNPQEYEAARMFSDFLGDEEIRYKQKSRNRGGGKSSTTISEQERTRKLFEPSQFLRLPQGKCVLINPGFTSKGEAAIPIRQTIKIPKADLQATEASEALWAKIQARLMQRSPQRVPTTEDLERRRQLVESMLPEPPAPVNSAYPDPADLIDKYGSLL
ncbi:Coupling protein TraD [Halomicronema hongdechloris C2206]|uniref:Coupling protein TraD n=1 Tax=Halomicronema hongdechloris C2206 TaxID=1641165 RepID=A0A1Z3HJB9_9CYAN|nr:type IV secretion system DNA-binding domain-containing protein [Halomicronema hongdechloris]ASC70390.1 Coupling protein TraD [Halomicronema hongdechloris C2206]